MTRTTVLALATAVALPVASASAAPKPPAASAPTLKAAPAIVVWGATTTLSGKVPGAKAGEVVKLQRDPFPLGDGWLDYKQATLAKNGAFSFTVPPTIATTYRAVAGTAASPGVTVKVRPSVGLVTSRSSGLTRFQGSVRPARAGATVSIQRKTPTGAWSTVKTAKLTKVSSTRSTYSVRLKVASAGTYRAKLAAGSGYLSGVSRERAVAAS